MMRAIEFAARLDFDIESGTYEAIVRHRNEILKASPPRVSEELLELLRRGWSHDSIRRLLDSGLLEPLLPELYRPLQKGRLEYFWKMLKVLDRTVQSGRRVSDAVLLSVLLLPFVIEELESEETVRGGRLRLADVLIYIRELIQPVFQRMALAAGVRHQVEQVLESLWRLLEPPADRRSQWRFVLREPFGDALALFELFALSSGRYVESFREWRMFSQRVRKGEVSEQSRGSSVGRRRRRRKRT